MLTISRAHDDHDDIIIIVAAMQEWGGEGVECGVSQWMCLSSLVTKFGD